MHLPSSTPSDETLLGYLLNALPDDQHLAIDSLLESNPSLGERLKALSELIKPIEELKAEAYEPHFDLVTKTLALIESTPAPVVEPHPPAIAGLSSVLDSAHRTVKLAWADSLVLIAAGITILCILLPSVWYSREESRRFACANNLGQLGHSLHRFTSTSPAGLYPSIDVRGPLSFAGVYVVKLNESRLLDSTSWLWCPSSGGASFRMSLPNSQQIVRASAPLQDAWKRTIGGSYAYNLGTLTNGIYQTPRGTSPNVPILGDALMEVDLGEVRDALVHGRHVVNILYSDGQVRSVRIPEPEAEWTLDHPFLNRSLINAAGEDRMDNCLGPSYQSPVSTPILFKPSSSIVNSVPMLLK